MDYTAPSAYVQLGDFEYQANPWNTGNLIDGKDFSQRLALAPDGHALRLEWMFPADLNDIVAYPGLIWGMKPWSTTSTTPLLPIRIHDINELTVDFDTPWAPQPHGNHNLAFDIWIASATTDGPETRLSEVMVWVKNWDWTITEDAVATYVDMNGTAKIRHRASHRVGDGTWAYTSVIYDDDVTHGTLDLARLLDRLSELGLVDAGDYLMDIEFGAEVVNGQGWFDVHRYDITLNGEISRLTSPALYAMF